MAFALLDVLFSVWAIPQSAAFYLHIHHRLMLSLPVEWMVRYPTLATSLYQSRKSATMRWAVFPSHFLGMRPVLVLPSRIFCAASIMVEVSNFTRVFVPSRMVMGRSVFGRKVRQGIPKKVDSSWIPPESVRMN